MRPYTEPDICLGGIPDTDSLPCPPSGQSPQPTNLPMTMSGGAYSFTGTLRSDLPDRVNRVNQLVLLLWKRLNFISDAFSGIFSHTYKYPSIEPRKPPIPPKTVTGSAFGIVVKMLSETDVKMDLLLQEMESIRCVASVPEHWQLKPESRRPIAVFLFGELSPGSTRIDSPKWQICVPHASPSALGGFSNEFGYRKGSYQFLLTLADNSKVIFYGDDPAQMERILDRWKGIISSSMLSGSFLKKGQIQGLGFSVRELRLVRIDYYSSGNMAGNPSQVFYFSRNVQRR